MISSTASPSCLMAINLSISGVRLRDFFQFFKSSTVTNYLKLFYFFQLSIVTNYTWDLQFERPRFGERKWSRLNDRGRYPSQFPAWKKSQVTLEKWLLIRLSRQPVIEQGYYMSDCHVKYEVTKHMSDRRLSSRGGKKFPSMPLTPPPIDSMVILGQNSATQI